MRPPHSKPFLYANLKTLPKDFSAGTVAIGNFDGFHLGHQALIAAAMENAAGYDEPAYALSFDPHPRLFFRPDAEPFQIISAEARTDLAKRLGLDGLLIATFDEAFSALSPREFVRDILVGKLGVRHVITGFDFHFGQKRAGTPRTLEDLAGEFGFSVDVISAHGDEEGKYSSSSVRADLKDGNMAAAEHRLGYPWFFDGKVIHGEKRGRDLGYPTANTKLENLTPLKEGVFAVKARRSSGECLEGVASYGRRPQFDNGAPLFETYFFDFSGSLYDETLRLFPLAYIRPEMKFGSVEALISQMDSDSAAARRLLADHEPETELARQLLFG